MTWNPAELLPTEAELAELNRRLDWLVDYLLRENDPGENLRAVENLAGALGVPVHFEPANPMQQMDALGDQWVTSVLLAGSVLARRAQVVTNTRGKLRELTDVFRWWLEEKGVDTSPHLALNHP